MNAVRTSDHPRHQRRHLGTGVRTLVAGNTEMFISESRQPERLSQGNEGASPTADTRFGSSKTAPATCRA
jgi:hypothetical protein